jgi:hypothetical protein
MEPYELFSYELDNLYERVLKDYELLLKQNLITKEDILNEDFEALLDEYGYKDIEAKYADALTELAFKFGNPTPAIEFEVESRKSLALEYLVGKKLETGSKFKQLIFDMIDKPFVPDEFEARKAGIKLTDAQFNAAVTTAYAETSRNATREAYKDDPNARFKYIGGILKSSSKQCEWLMIHQRKEGYTIAEIDAGIDTPYRDKNGDVLKIYWCGRVPNINCIHEWVYIAKKKNG